MSDFDTLSSAERKKEIHDKQELLRSLMTEQEYADLQKELDACEINYSMQEMSVDEALSYMQSKGHGRQKGKDKGRLDSLYRDKPVVLVFLANLISKIFPLLMTVYTVAVIPILVMAWQIYKLISADSWQAIFHTEKTLYVVGYCVIFFVLTKLQIILYRYANE